jgi:hypothetical protein
MAISKQIVLVVRQKLLIKRIADAFNERRGSIRILTVSEKGSSCELVVDYKIIHGYQVHQSVSRGKIEASLIVTAEKLDSSPPVFRWV